MSEKIHKENYKRIKNDIKKEIAKCPKHKSDKAQTHAVGGIGITGMLGCASAEAFELGVDFLGENVVEYVGGGTGLSIVLFFLVKFFTLEKEELYNRL